MLSGPTQKKKVARIPRRDSRRHSGSTPSRVPLKGVHVDPQPECHRNLAPIRGAGGGPAGRVLDAIELQRVMPARHDERRGR